jgi:cell wall-associated NlpC family hydrolase
MTHWVDKYIDTEYGVGPGQRQCWGLIQDVYLGELGIKLEDFRPMDDSDIADTMRVGRTFRREILKWQKVEDPREFDVVVMSGYAQDQDRVVRAPLHAGVVVGTDRVLHVEQGRGANCVLLSHWTVSRKILAFCRHELMLEVARV